MKKGIIFDMDGVIFDSENLIFKCWKKVAAEYGIKDIDTIFPKCLGTTKTATEKIVKDAYGKDFEYEVFREKTSEMFSAYIEKNGVPKKPYIDELLMHLKSKNYKLAVASSTREVIVKKELKMAKLYEYFDVILGGDQIENSKPAPDIYLKACKMLMLNPMECFAVEDSYNGVRSANNAKIDVFMIPDIMPPTDEMREISYEIYDSLNSLIYIL